MQPPTWLLTGLAGVVIGVAGLGIGYELRDDGGTVAVTAETTQPAALPTSCAWLSDLVERVPQAWANRAQMDTKAADLWTMVDRLNSALTARDKACR